MDKVDASGCVNVVHSSTGSASHPPHTCVGRCVSLTRIPLLNCSASAALACVH